MRIKKLVIRDMWSFGGEPTNLDFSDDGNTTTIIGKNNSGKSNILNAILWSLGHDHTQWLIADTSAQFNPPAPVPHDYGNTEKVATPHLSLQCEFSKAEAAQILDQPRYSDKPGGYRTALLKLICGGMRLEADANWTAEQCKANRVTFLDSAASTSALEEQFVGLPGGFDRQSLIIQLVNDILPSLSKRVTKFTGWRKLDDRTSAGLTIMEVLSKWERPKQEERHRQRDHARIRSQFHELLRIDNIELTPESGGTTLNLTWHGRYLPIGSYGDGIQHLLMLAFEFALHENHVFLIEEPETHLHPELQRHLLDIAKADSTNQFIFTTHSPVFLDSGLSDCILRVEYDGDISYVSECIDKPDIYKVLDDLDCRASDLLQSNCVIWVEGPTDRMFLKRCFDLLEFKWIEGQHYQIMFYGGSLRAHVTLETEPNDPAVNRLINLLSLSRNVAMICDSDRKKEGGDINATKKRLHAECEDVKGFSWVTDGREIENYISNRALTATWSRLLGRETSVDLPNYSRLADVIAKLELPEKCAAWKTDYGNNKPQLMEEILQDVTRKDIEQNSGLMKRLSGLDAFIASANSASATVAS